MLFLAFKAYILRSQILYYRFSAGFYMTINWFARYAFKYIHLKGVALEAFKGLALY